MKTFVLLLALAGFSVTAALAQEEFFTYNDKGKRNPFFPLVDEQGRYLLESDLPYSSAELQLTGILWDPQGNSSALVNNEVVKVGESIGGFTVQQISKDSVKMVKDGKEYIFKLAITEKGE